MKRYTHRKVTRRGKKDGRNWQWEFWPFFRKEKQAEPKADQTMPAPFETELVQASENATARIIEKWKKLDEVLKPRYCQARSALILARQRARKEGAEAQAAMSEFETAEKKFQDLDMPALDPRWRLFWLIVIGVAELPLNGLVFSIFGARRIETYIMASAMCLAIPMAAHFFGQALRQENKTAVDKGFLLIIPTIILVVLAAIAFLRAKFFEAIQSQQLMGITLTPSQATILFIIINIALFLVAIIVSYEGSHPNHRLYNTLRQRFKHALKRLQKESGESEIAAKRLASAEYNFHRERQRREKSHEKLGQEANTIKETTDWLISAYRAANLSVRRDIPECFKTQPASLQIPEPLLHLDWECGEIMKKEIEEESK